MTGGVIVTKLERAEHGEFEARVHLNGATGRVTRRFGSWMIRTGPDSLADVPRWLAAELQSRLPADERKIKRGKVKNDGNH